MLTPTPVAPTVEGPAPRTHDQIIERLREVLDWDVTQVRACMLASFLPADTVVALDGFEDFLLAGDIRERRRSAHQYHPPETALAVAADELGLWEDAPLTEPAQVWECRLALKRTIEALWVARVEVTLPLAVARGDVVANVQELQRLIAKRWLG